MSALTASYLNQSTQLCPSALSHPPLLPPFLRVFFRRADVSAMERKTFRGDARSFSDVLLSKVPPTGSRMDFFYFFLKCYFGERCLNKPFVKGSFEG